MLRPKCNSCGSTAGLYCCNCRHMTLCLTCGQSMTEKAGDDVEVVGNDPEEREDLAPEVLAPPEIKQMDDDIDLLPKPKEEPAESSPSKPVASGSASKSAKGKRKADADDTKPSKDGNTYENMKTENERKSSVKEENGTSCKRKTGSTSSSNIGAGAVTTEDEMRAFIVQKGPVTILDLVVKFKARLKTPEDKMAFAAILRRISRIRKIDVGAASYVVLK